MKDDNMKAKLKALNKLIYLMAADNDLPRDLQITFQEIHDFIIRNQ